MIKKLSLILFLNNFLFLFSYAQEVELLIATRQFPPFEFIENDKIVGINQETISNILKKIGYTVKFVPLPWKRALITTEDGITDAIASIKKSPNLANAYVFSNPIMYIQDSFYKKKTLNLTATTLKDLSKYKIGIVDKYFYGLHFTIQNFPKIFPLTSSTPEIDNLEKLNAGRVDLILCPANICNYWLNKYPKLFSNIQIINHLSVDEPQALYLAFSKNNKNSAEIIKKFNDELKKYLAEGAITKSIKKYDPYNKLGIIIPETLSIR